VLANRLFLFLLIAPVCLLSACSGADDLAGSSITGQIQSMPESWSSSTAFVYAAQYTGSTAGEGYFVLEPDMHPHAALKKNGGFAIRDLPAGSYILLAGPNPEEALRLVNTDGSAVIVEISAEQGLDLGDIFVIN